MNIKDIPFNNVTKRKPYRFVLPRNLFVESWVVPMGTEVVLTVGENFGYVVLPHGCKDIHGIVIPRRIFKY